MKKEEVTVKATKEGVLVLLDDLQDFGTIKHALKKKLQTTEGLSGGTNILLELGRRQVSAKEKKQLEKIVRQTGMVLKRINVLSEPIRPAPAGSGGKPAEQSRDRDRQKSPEKPLSASETLPIMLGEISQQIAATKEEPHIAKQDTDALTETLAVESLLPVEGETLLVIKTLRSGHIVNYDGNVVVLGDVNPGAAVEAGGHIVVMGYFRGLAHAGCFGNDAATVTAFRLQPTQLRIANHITRCPDGKYLAPNVPEVARVREGVVVIESYQANPDKQMKIS